MAEVSYCVVYTLKDGQRDAFVQKVFSSGLLAEIRDAEGCKSYDYYVSEESSERLMLMETWESDAHREAHLMRPVMDTLNALIEQYVDEIEHID